MAAQPDIPTTAQHVLADYLTITSLPVQWGDMDAFGHVNNVVYIQWFESARIDLLNSFPSAVTMAAGGVAPILASVRCDYKKQLHFPDTVYVGSKASKVGRTSFEIEHAVFSHQLQQIAAVGTSVVVVFDYATNRPVRIPEELRQQFAT